MKLLKFHDKIKALFLIAFLAFGFLGRVAFAEPTTEAECKASQGTDGYPGFCTLKSKGCGNGVTYGTCENTNSDGTVAGDRVCCLTSSPAGNITNDVDCKAKNGTCEDGSQCKDSSKVINGDCGKNTKTGITQICCTPPTSDTSYSGTASLNYTPLENLPGFEGQSGDFATYFGNLYKLALWIVAISALFMLVVGGFLYLSSAGNTALLGTAKKVIYSALIGLVIALISWLLLDTINSDLTNLKLTGLTGAIGTSSGTSGTSATPASGDTNKSGCEALKYVTVKEQCNLASSELVKILSCMESKGITNSIFSISSSAVGGDQTKASACCNNGHTSGCPHSGVTCHHGCTYGTKGLSYAADIQTSASDSDATLCAIASAAKSCGAGNVWGARTISSCGIVYQEGHNTHLHVSVAGCAH